MKKIWNIVSILLIAACLAGCPGNDSHNYPTAGLNNNSLDSFLPDSFRSDVWSALSANFRLDDNPDHELIKKEIDYFLLYRNYLNQLTSNAEPYIYYVYQQTRKRGMPAELALMPMVESNYTPFSISKSGATGLWQMMPGTASGFGIKIDWWYDGRRDIVASTNAALNYLAYLHNYFGNWLLAIAAYNSGEGTVRNAMAYNKKHGRPTDFWSLPLPYETKMYVPKLLALANIVSNASTYQYHLVPVENKPYFKKVTLHQQIDLNHVAQLAETTPQMIRLLNPGFRRWATTPNKSYTLLLPSNNADLFTENLAQNNTKLVTWIHHHVKPGESLASIATQFKTHPTIIAKINNINNNIIYPQQSLLIPISFKHLATNHPKAANIIDIAEDRIPGPKRVLHQVTANDNLWTIGARYHVTPEQIRYWNTLGYHDKLQINQNLVLWVQHHYPKAAFYTYNVRAGDSLSTIAQRFNTNPHTIQRLNHLRGDLIQIGLTLNIPKTTHQPHQHFIAKLNNQMITHHVHNGETLSSIAQYYSVPITNIRSWNHLSKNSLLARGQALHIYISEES